MDTKDAQYFAGEMEEFLNIPSLVCELIERKLARGEFEEVCNYIVQRRRELDVIRDKKALCELFENTL